MGGEATVSKQCKAVIDNSDTISAPAVVCVAFRVSTAFPDPCGVLWFYGG